MTSTPRSETMDKIAEVLQRAEITERDRAAYIVDILASDSSTRSILVDWAHSTVNEIYASEMSALADKSSGLHSIATSMTEEKLKSFNLKDLARTMSEKAPSVWSMLDYLFSPSEHLQLKRKRAREEANRSDKRTRRTMRQRTVDGDIEMEDVQLSTSADAEAPSIDNSEHREAQNTLIRKIVSLSIMLQTANQHCNALQSVIGIFLQSCNCPETLRDLLSRIGLSVSVSAINEAVNSLSEQAERSMRTLFQSLLALLAYDNVDLDLKHSVPTVESPESTLIHLTSGTLIPLSHVHLSDLDCSEELWKKAAINPSNRFGSTPTTNPQVTLKQLLNVHPDPLDIHGQGRHDRYSAWKFLYDLVNYGPPYFRKFKQLIGDPEEVECIPVPDEGTKQIPCRTLNIHPSLPAQNAEAVESFLRQGGIGEPSPTTPHLKDPGNHVILTSGDLLSAERVRSAMQSRAVEKTPWKRMQYIVFVMGLFHLKMAAADAVWRICIHPKKSKSPIDENSLMSYVGQTRPHETGKIESKPGFRRMHEVIQHTGIVLRLDCWRLIAQERNSNVASLSDFADTKPSLEALQDMARALSDKYPRSHKVLDLRNAPNEERDMQLENVMLQHKYFMMYEELSHSLNYGDIGRVECCMLQWMFVFLGCGKHKYGAEIRRYFENVHFFYPEGLKKAIRMNILINPTAKKGAFRAIDWLVELNNLYTKRIYGGKYSNHQLSRIIAESPLIEVYKFIRVHLERLFELKHKTTRHSPPDLEATFEKLANYLIKAKSHLYCKGRATKLEVANAQLEEAGMKASMMDKTAQDGSGVENDDDDEMEVDQRLMSKTWKMIH